MLNTALTFEIDTSLNDEGIAVEALRPLFRRESQVKFFLVSSIQNGGL